MLTHFSLFSGIGGIDLAAEWAGFETVGQCEFADYPTKVLEKHWPDVPRWRDIRSVTADSFYNKTGLRTVDVISGGFPCQPFSVAGKRKGKDDDRYLWPEMLRVISELKPSWVIGENVAGIVTMGESTPFSDLENDDVGSTTENMVLEEICKALENVGYEVQSVLIPACSIGAPHQRYRTFIVGHAKHDGQFTEQELRSNETSGNQWEKKEQNETGEFERTDRPADESGVRRGTDGIKSIMVGDSNGDNVKKIREFQSRERTKPCGICEDVADTNNRQFNQSNKELQTRRYAINSCGSDVPNTDNTGNRTHQCSNNSKRQTSDKGWQEFSQCRIGGPYENVSNTESTGQQGGSDRQGQKQPWGSDTRASQCFGEWWSVEPNVGRVANGVPNRVDRLKCLGNAVVPQQVYPILKCIADIERSQEETG